MGKTLADILAAHRSAPIPRLPEHLTAYQPIIDRLLAKDAARIDMHRPRNFSMPWTALRAELDSSETQQTHSGALDS